MGGPLADNLVRANRAYRIAEQLNRAARARGIDDPTAEVNLNAARDQLDGAQTEVLNAVRLEDTSPLADRLRSAEAAYYAAVETLDEDDRLEEILNTALDDLETVENEVLQEVLIGSIVRHEEVEARRRSPADLANRIADYQLPHGGDLPPPGPMWRGRTDRPLRSQSAPLQRGKEELGRNDRRQTRDALSEPPQRGKEEPEPQLELQEPEPQLELQEPEPQLGLQEPEPQRGKEEPEPQLGLTEEERRRVEEQRAQNRALIRTRNAREQALDGGGHEM